MTTDYDPIAERYKRAKQQPWRTFIECFTLLECIGDPHGLAVLDIACGEGFYARLLRQRGAAKVVEIDLSKGMIDLARSQEAQHPLGIEYVVGDAKNLSTEGSFDMAVAAYLLNYACNPEELQAMCNAIATALKPGGRFVTVNCNPSLHFPSAPSYRKYQFETSTLGRWQEGAPIEWTFHLSDGPVTVENYHLNTETHETALRQAGFQNIRWHSPRVSPEGLMEDDRGFWSTFLDHSPITFLECWM